jgi:translation initiation factor 2D
MLKGAEVSRYVLGGADLMFPGIDVHGQDLPMFAAGEPWSIMVPGNPFPIAVGTTLLSSAEAIKAHLRGKALHVMHYYRDMLWSVPSSPCPCFVLLDLSFNHGSLSLLFMMR